MIQDIIRQIEAEAKDVFGQLDGWFDADFELLNYRPLHGGWSASQVLSHISLTNYYLLILIKKGTARALQLAAGKGDSDFLEDYRLDRGKLKAIGDHGAFIWRRPDHMEPTGLLNLAETRMLLHEQMQDCLVYLNQMPNGEGALYLTTMTVNNLGKLDVYHYIYFLIQHAKRHLTQLELIREEMNKAL
jgi:DinB superfamily